VVHLRSYAATNPNAWGFKHPITIEEHQQSRWIAEPAIRLFDCCQETDGSVALVLTTADRAVDSPHPPVHVRATAAAGLFEQEIASDYYLPHLENAEGCAAMARRLFAAAAMRPEDLDGAMIYDAFTPMLFQQIEALGLCGAGEAKDFIADGQMGLDGRLPCNTNGGLIGEGYIHGLNLVSEAVRQVRGTAVNQIPNPENILVSASRTGAILSRNPR
jgi:acetyl-CoA acetyltransferase